MPQRQRRHFDTYKVVSKPKVILGVDVGLQNMAFAAIDAKRQVLKSRMIEHTLMNLKPYRTKVGPKAKQIWSEDLNTELEIHSAQVHNLLDEIKPDVLVMERFMTRGTKKGNPTELCPFMIGVWAGIAVQRELPFILLTAAEWKNRVQRELCDLEDLYEIAKQNKLPVHQVDAYLIAEYTLSLCEFKEMHWSMTKPTLKRVIKCLAKNH